MTQRTSARCDCPLVDILQTAPDRRRQTALMGFSPRPILVGAPYSLGGPVTIRKYHYPVQEEVFASGVVSIQFSVDLSGKGTKPFHIPLEKRAVIQGAYRLFFKNLSRFRSPRWIESLIASTLTFSLFAMACMVNPRK